MNNEQVIKYVSENSKNPHAAMIAEWLLTGWDVEFFDDEYKRWCNCGDNATWYGDIKYRLVKPKIKPAYRVYRYLTYNYTYTQERYDDGRESTLPEGAIIVQDWTEYDPWPTPLVERIAAIDIKAAEWIVDHWDDLLKDRYTFGGKYSREASELCDMFSWHQAPQENDYWRRISGELGEI